MEASVFNPVQLHLLKMFAYDGSEDTAEHFRKKADECLDDLWNSVELNQAKLDSLRHQKNHI